MVEAEHQLLEKLEAFNANVLAAVPAAAPTRPRIIPSQRSAAQKAAAARFQQPRAIVDAQPEHKPAPPPLIGSEAFYRHKQSNIKAYRTAYNSRVEQHESALRDGGAGGATAAAPRDAIGLLAHERASRHVEGITKPRE